MYRRMFQKQNNDLTVFKFSVDEWKNGQNLTNDYDDRQIK